MPLLMLPRQLVVDVNGVPRIGAKIYVYDAGTSTPRTTYTTPAFSVTNTHPVESVSGGLFPEIWINPAGGNYKIYITDEDDVALYPAVDNIPAYGLTAAEIGALINVRTDAEIAAGVTPTDYAYEPGDVRRYGGAGDDSTVNDTPIANAMLQAAQSGGAEVVFVTGTYRHANTLELGTADRLRIRGIGKVYLKHTGTGVAVSVNSVASGGTPHIKDLEITNLEVTGNANTTYAWDIAKVTRSKIDVRARNCTTAGMRMRFGVLNDVYFSCSDNEAAFTTTPVVGLVLEQLASGSETTTGCNFYVIIEHVSGDGIVVTRGDSNTFVGTSEGNGGLGISLSANATLNRCVGLFMEANGTGDVDCDGDSNTFQDCTASTRAGGSPFDSVPSYLFGSTGRLNAVIGGFCYSALVESGAVNTLFLGVNVEDDVNDSGTRTAIINTRQGLLSSEALPSQLPIMEAWTTVTPQNSWNNTSGTFHLPQYARDYSRDHVVLRGEMGGGSLGTTLFTLPSTHRPVKRWTFIVPATAGSADAVVQINTDGTVTHVSGDTTSIDLAAIWFTRA